MRLLFNLAILGLVIFAGIQSGASIWRFYAFRDVVRQEAWFAGDRTTVEISRRVLAHADRLGVPVDPYDVVVQFEGDVTVISVVYEDEIPLVPALYSYQHLYDASADSRVRPSLSGRQLPVP
jgi:hypothetical protein